MVRVKVKCTQDISELTGRKDEKCNYAYTYESRVKYAPFFYECPRCRKKNNVNDAHQEYMKSENEGETE